MSLQKICKKCVLPATFPGIRFNAAGVCNFCMESKRSVDDAAKKAEYRRKFEALLQECRGNSTYDAMICYSGGKDSTYTLSILKKKYGLNVLAVTVDNGFISAQALNNIRTVVENLGVEHISFKPRFDVLTRIFRHCVNHDIYSRKSLERASSICTSCMAIVKYSTLRFALEKDIPLVVYGWSPGQSPVTSSIIKNNPRIVKLMQKSVYDPLYRFVGREITPYFLEDKHFSDVYRFPYYVHPLAFLGYNEAEIYKNVASLGWKLPDDTDANSTNCLLNSFANMVHKHRLGFHPYAYELANLIRGGYLDRPTALARLDQVENPGIIAIVKERLGIKKVHSID
jgi:tRNA(Ile)-lysidine synthase TilS/MesJ